MAVRTPRDASTVGTKGDERKHFRDLNAALQANASVNCILIPPHRHTSNLETDFIIIGKKLVFVVELKTYQGATNLHAKNLVHGRECTAPSIQIDRGIRRLKAEFEKNNGNLNGIENDAFPGLRNGAFEDNRFRGIYWLPGRPSVPDKTGQDTVVTTALDLANLVASWDAGFQAQEWTRPQQDALAIYAGEVIPKDPGYLHIVPDQVTPATPPELVSFYQGSLPATLGVVSSPAAHRRPNFDAILQKLKETHIGPKIFLLTGEGPTGKSAMLLAIAHASSRDAATKACPVYRIDDPTLTGAWRAIINDLGAVRRAMVVVEEVTKDAADVLLGGQFQPRLTVVTAKCAHPKTEPIPLDAPQAPEKRTLRNSIEALLDATLTPRPNPNEAARLVEDHSPLAIGDVSWFLSNGRPEALQQRLVDFSGSRDAWPVMGAIFLGGRFGLRLPVAVARQIWPDSELLPVLTSGLVHRDGDYLGAPNSRAAQIAWDWGLNLKWTLFGTWKVISETVGGEHGKLAKDVLQGIEMELPAEQVQKSRIKLREVEVAQITPSAIAAMAPSAVPVEASPKELVLRIVLTTPKTTEDVLLQLKAAHGREGSDHEKSIAKNAAKAWLYSHPDDRAVLSAILNYARRERVQDDVDQAFAELLELANSEGLDGTTAVLLHECCSDTNKDGQPKPTMQASLRHRRTWVSFLQDNIYRLPYGAWQVAVDVLPLESDQRRVLEAFLKRLEKDDGGGPEVVATLKLAERSTLLNLASKVFTTVNDWTTRNQDDMGEQTWIAWAGWSLGRHDKLAISAEQKNGVLKAVYTWLKDHPSAQSLWEQHVHHLQERGRKKEASDRLDEAIVANPESPAIKHKLKLFKAQFVRGTEAIDEIRQTFQNQRTAANARRLAQALAKRGDLAGTTEAEPLFRQILGSAWPGGKGLEFGTVHASMLGGTAVEFANFLTLRGRPQEAIAGLQHCFANDARRREINETRFHSAYANAYSEFVAPGFLRAPPNSTSIVLGHMRLKADAAFRNAIKAGDVIAGNPFGYRSKYAAFLLRVGDPVSADRVVTEGKKHATDQNAPLHPGADMLLAVAIGQSPKLLPPALELLRGARELIEKMGEEPGRDTVGWRTELVAASILVGAEQEFAQKLPALPANDLLLTCSPGLMLVHAVLAAKGGDKVLSAQLVSLAMKKEKELPQLVEILLANQAIRQLMQ